LLVSDDRPSSELEKALHRTIERVTGDMERLSFNTAIAALIEFMPGLVALERIPRSIAEPFLLMLAPLAPHLSEELWHRMGHEQSLSHEPWPEADAQQLVVETMRIAIQVNGKLRASIDVAAETEQQEILRLAKSDDNVVRHLAGKDIRREIYVPGRIVNLVVG
jgi:leucyl-tRNA synthetase